MNDPEPGGNRTVFRPSPLQGLKAVATPQPADTARPPAPSVSTGEAGAMVSPAPRPAGPVTPTLPATGNVMLAAMAPMLALVAGMRAGRVRMPLAQLHRQATAAIADADRAIRAAYPEEVARRAVYALAATIDDVAQNLPGLGNDGAEWAKRSLVVQVFQARIGGDRFWQFTDETLRAPDGPSDLAELYHACLAAGFEDRFRAAPDGKRQLHEIMARLQQVLRRRAPAMAGLSPHWRGEDAPVSRLGTSTYVAVAAAATAALLLLAYIALRLLLLSTAAAPADALAAINPDAPLRLSRGGASVAPSPPSPAAAALRAALAPDIAQGAIAIEEDPAAIRIRTIAGPLFATGSDQLAPGRAELFGRIAAALRSQPGTITVEDHVAGGEGASLAFPDATALSTARANRIAALVRSSLGSDARVTGRGMGATVPIADNATPDGKAHNDRVETVVPKGRAS